MDSPDRRNASQLCDSRPYDQNFKDKKAIVDEIECKKNTDVAT